MNNASVICTKIDGDILPVQFKEWAFRPAFKHLFTLRSILERFSQHVEVLLSIGLVPDPLLGTFSLTLEEKDIVALTKVIVDGSNVKRAEVKALDRVEFLRLAFRVFLFNVKPLCALEAQLAKLVSRMESSACRPFAPVVARQGGNVEAA